MRMKYLLSVRSHTCVVVADLFSELVVSEGLRQFEVVVLNIDLCIVVVGVLEGLVDSRCHEMTEAADDLTLGVRGVEDLRLPPVMLSQQVYDKRRHGVDVGSDPR